MLFDDLIDPLFDCTCWLTDDHELLHWHECAWPEIKAYATLPLHLLLLTHMLYSIAYTLILHFTCMEVADDIWNERVLGSWWEHFRERVKIRASRLPLEFLVVCCCLYLLTFEASYRAEMLHCSAWFLLVVWSGEVCLWTVCLVGGWVYLGWKRQNGF